MFKTLKEILEKNFLDLQGRKDFQEKWIFLHWSKSVGPEIAMRTSPQRLAGDTLFVDAVSSVWASQLTSMREQIKGTLNRAIAPLSVRDIRSGVKYPLSTRWNLFIDEEKELESPSPEPLTEEEEKNIEELCASLEDEKQRRALHSILKKETQWKKKKESEGWKTCAGCGALSEQGRLCPFCRQEKR